MNIGEWMATVLLVVVFGGYSVLLLGNALFGWPRNRGAR